MRMAEEAWLRGPVDGIAPVFQPAAHALLQAREDVQALAPTLSGDSLWKQAGAATAGFHLMHLAGALDRLFTYARGEKLNDEQKAAARAEAIPHPELSGAMLAQMVSDAVERGLTQLRATPAESAFDHRGIGRAGLPSTSAA